LRATQVLRVTHFVRNRKELKALRMAMLRLAMPPLAMPPLARRSTRCCE
jgi:hypothetical protein